MFESGSRVPGLESGSQGLLRRPGGWEAYVRAAAPSNEGESTEWEEEGSSSTTPLLCPLHFPPPPTLPTRTTKGFFSTFVLVGRDKARVSVPASMIVRNHNTAPIKLQRSICMGCSAHHNCTKGWQLPPAKDIIVLSARDIYGFTHYGWYLRFDVDPHRLVRVPLTIVEGLWAQVRKDPELKGSSLNAELVDAYMTADGMDFEAMATLRIDQIAARIKRIRGACASTSGNKRIRTEEGLPSKPASPDRGQSSMATTVKGECSVCLDEALVHKGSCCGNVGAMCTGCRANMRNLCPVCDRAQINATYQCASCTSAITFKEFGYPCSSCNKCTLCSGCFQQFEECVDCDVVSERRY